MNWYHRKLTKLKYDISIFDDIIEYAKTAKWKDGYDQNKLLWNVQELPLSANDFPILNEIYEGFNADFKRKSFFISSVKPGGLVNHIDHRKWGNFGIPLNTHLTNFKDTPQYYYDQFNHPVESFVLDSPTLFNVRMLHAVPRSIDDIQARWVLMMDVFEWVDHLFEKIDNDTIWTDTTNFKYEK
jgi:hypothetical protein